MNEDLKSISQKESKYKNFNARKIPFQIVKIRWHYRLCFFVFKKNKTKTSKIKMKALFGVVLIAFVAQGREDYRVNLVNFVMTS